MTISELVSDIRGFIRKYDDDTIDLSDRYIISILTKGIALSNRRKVEKHGFYSTWNFQTFQVELEAAKITDVNECIPVGCDVLKTKYKIPSPVKTNRGELVRVTNLANQQIFRLDFDPTIRSLDPVLKRKLAWTVINNKIVIYGGDTENVIPNYINVKGVWEDITEWETIPKCGDTTTTDSNGNVQKQISYCFERDTTDLQLDADQAFMVYEYTLNLLNLPLSLLTQNEENVNH